MSHFRRFYRCEKKIKRIDIKKGTQHIVELRYKKISQNNGEIKNNEGSILTKIEKFPSIYYSGIFTKMLLYSAAAAAAKSLQSCPTLCDPIDGSPTGSPVPGILQARTLEWVSISFSNA